MDLMHIAACHVLSAYGYYKLDRITKMAGPIELLPLNFRQCHFKEQDLLLKKAEILFKAKYFLKKAFSAF